MRAHLAHGLIRIGLILLSTGLCFGFENYTTSAGTVDDGSDPSILYMYTNPNSSTLEYSNTSAAYTARPAFEITLALPDLPGFTLNSASIDLNTLITSTSGPSFTLEGTGWQATNCGFFGDEACPYTTASASLSGGYQLVTDEITAPGKLYTGCLDNGILDLTSLGFGAANLLNGGTLTVSGYLSMTSQFSITDNGYDDWTEDFGSYQVDSSESASLAIDSTAPEPSTFALMGDALLVCATIASLVRGGRNPHARLEETRVIPDLG